MRPMKDYNLACPFCLQFTPPQNEHCGKCHEIFLDQETMKEHIHRKTGGCMFPGTIERFYYIQDDQYQVQIWIQKPDPNEEKK